ncbi:hypothetical protein [Pelosinus fermentans]|uniref:Uncharacterized protein n=1 Tax=Pelosinus fermentans JBW45 TaxID=1192197 RepID=I8TY62_9FIRM|nr:hypothetical protein [Pelosinus fermentans]AJQ27526.1 hypothetical protein JBW_02178 [Pelosinus fermentans JBW45]
MYIHIAWLYLAAVIGCLVGILIAAMCAAAKSGDWECRFYHTKR